ncbi:MAG: 30S ribosomal protein S20 [Candidatus Aureabacteria bacterium]|nr:30S ribosomal protein S20 [Candidatus Auribacterota bacterium]
MPNRKNAVLQIKKDAKRTVRNQIVKASLKTARKKFELVLKEGNKEKASAAFVRLQTILDKTVKKGVIRLNRCSRLKSRYMKKIAKLT